MLRNILKMMIGISLIIIMFSACKSYSDTEGIEIKVVDGYIKDATVQDSSGQTATYTSNGTYEFRFTPTYPITSTGGTLEDTGVTFDLNMSISNEETKVLSPITSFLGTDSTRLAKFTELGLGLNTLDEFSVDYVSTGNTDLAKLSQVLYVMLRDSTLSETFQTSVENSSSLSSLTDLFTLASNDVNNSSDLNDHQKAQINNVLTEVKSYSGTAANIESDLDAFKYNLVTRGTTTLTHNGLSYGIVKSPHTGKYWLDRNIGASQVCTSMTDTNCYGDYFQWGRSADGHEKSTSSTTTTKATSLVPGHSNFIDVSTDWTTDDSARTQRAANWAATDGSSVCPSGYRVPTIDELAAETTDLTGDFAVSNATDAFNGFLGLPAGGYRFTVGGNMQNVGTLMSIASTTLGTTKIKTFDADSSSAVIFQNSTISYGINVRCIQN